MSTPRHVVPLVAGITLFLLISVSVWAQASADPLRRGFENPPNWAQPPVWWHWMNGNITQEGIKLDLEWMHRVGIAGFQNFDAAIQTYAARDTIFAGGRAPSLRWRPMSSRVRLFNSGHTNRDVARTSGSLTMHKVEATTMALITQIPDSSLILPSATAIG